MNAWDPYYSSASPGLRLVKEKRGRLKPLLARLHGKFNISTAEMDLQDKWQETIISCAMISSDASHIERSLQNVAKWVEANWTDGDIIEQRIELIS